MGGWIDKKSQQYQILVASMFSCKSEIVVVVCVCVCGCGVCVCVCACVSNVCASVCVHAWNV